ncbi:hypothetical protein AWV80_04825 [Cupriavidus sp. UYMU48A]|nr:hypothetical protein AWV80_04825 [Cupriavidus sp. UYMU48A]
MINANPTHPKVPDAMIAVANNRLESGQKAAARKTLEQGVIVRNVQNVTVTAREASSSKAFRFRFN